MPTAPSARKMYVNSRRRCIWQSYVAIAQRFGAGPSEHRSLVRWARLFGHISHWGFPEPVWIVRGCPIWRLLGPNGTQRILIAVRALPSWLDRKLAAADSVFSLQSGDGRGGFEAPGLSTTLSRAHGPLPDPRGKRGGKRGQAPKKKEKKGRKREKKGTGTQLGQA